MFEEPLLKHVMTNRIIHLDKTSTVKDACTLMEDKDISSIIVLDKNRLAGAVSERDLVRKVLGRSRQPDKVSLGEIMSRVEKIDADSTLFDAARLMRDSKAKIVLVIDGNQAVGIVTETDVIELYPAIYGHPDFE